MQPVHEISFVDETFLFTYTKQIMKTVTNTTKEIKVIYALRFSHILIKAKNFLPGILLLFFTTTISNFASSHETYTYYFDGDGDGYGKTNSPTTTNSPFPPPGYAKLSGDCDDSKASVNPGATEICGDGIDNNCDGQIDEG